MKKMSEQDVAIILLGLLPCDTKSCDPSSHGTSNGNSVHFNLSNIWKTNGPARKQSHTNLRHSFLMNLFWSLVRCQAIKSPPRSSFLGPIDTRRFGRTYSTLSNTARTIVSWQLPRCILISTLKDDQRPEYEAQGHYKLQFLIDA